MSGPSQQPGSKLTIIIPVYNEEATLRSTLERLFKVDLPLDYEAIVVDDGSTDSGIASISDLVDDAKVKLLRHPSNRGKGAALETGVKNASGDLLTILDADLEYDPHDYSILLEPILEGQSEVVYGTRSFGANTAFSFWYVIGNRALSLWASFLFNTWLSDIETCFKVAPTSVWQSLAFRSKGFGVEAEITGMLLKRDFRIYEIPIRYRARSRLEGKKLTWVDGFGALWILFRIRLFGR